MVSFSLRQRITLPPPPGLHSGVLSFESIRPLVVTCYELAAWGTTSNAGSGRFSRISNMAHHR